MNWAASVLDGVTAFQIDADKKYATRVMLSRTKNLSKVAVLLDGLGPGAGAQVAKVAVYDGASGALLATSDEVTVVSGQPLGWVDFGFSETLGDLTLIAGPYDVAIHGGPLGDVIRVYGTDPIGAGGKWNADTYADGPAAAFGSATAVTYALDLYMGLFESYASVLPVTDDFYYARLPFGDAQDVFMSSGLNIGSAQLLDVGWHSTFQDPETGANALVRDGSKFADAWLGQRIKITTIGQARPRSASVYVHNLAPSDFDWDLSLTRKVFSRLGLLSADTIQCLVEVLG